MAIKEQEIIKKLEKLGFKTAGEKVKRLTEKKRKLAIAYEHYRYVRQEKIDAFNERLKKQTYKPASMRNETYESWQTLRFDSIDTYSDVPPEAVLAELETAITRNCFDSYEVAHIVTEVKLPDPILFGRIAGCPDRFFIAQWDEDVKIEDILSSKEG